MEINTVNIRLWDYSQKGELAYQTWITSPELVKPSNPDQTPFRRQREWDNFEEKGAVYYFRQSSNPSSFWYRLKCLKAATGEWRGSICTNYDPNYPKKRFDPRIPSSENWYQMTSWQVRGISQTDKGT